MNLRVGTAPSSAEPASAVRAAPLLESTQALTGKPQDAAPGVSARSASTGEAPGGRVLPQRQEGAASGSIAKATGSDSTETAEHSRSGATSNPNSRSDLTPLLKLLLDSDLIGSMVEQLRNLPAVPADHLAAVQEAPIPEWLPPGALTQLTQLDAEAPGPGLVAVSAPAFVELELEVDVELEVKGEVDALVAADAPGRSAAATPASVGVAMPVGVTRSAPAGASVSPSAPANDASAAATAFLADPDIATPADGGGSFTAGIKPTPHRLPEASRSPGAGLHPEPPAQRLPREAPLRGEPAQAAHSVASASLVPQPPTSRSIFQRLPDATALMAADSQRGKSSPLSPTNEPPRPSRPEGISPGQPHARPSPLAPSDEVAFRLIREAPAPQGSPMQGIDTSPSAARPVVFHSEPAAIAIAIPAARDMGLRDGQVIQALVASDTNGLSIAVNGKAIRLPATPALRAGQQIALVVTTDARGQILKLQPEPAASAVPGRTDNPEAAPGAGPQMPPHSSPAATASGAPRSNATPSAAASMAGTGSHGTSSSGWAQAASGRNAVATQGGAVAPQSAIRGPDAESSNPAQSPPLLAPRPDAVAAPPNLESTLALLLSPHGTPALGQLLAPGFIERVLGNLVSGTLARGLQAARPRPDALSGPELRRIMRASGLFTESLLSRGIGPAEGDLKVLLGRLVEIAPEQSETHALAHQALSEVASAQVKALQAQAEQQVLLSILVPFADGHPVRLTFSRSTPSRERPTPPFVVDVESMTGPLGEVSLRTTIQMPTRLDLTMWAARPEVAALARTHAAGLETELARAGLELTSMAVHDGKRPAKPAGASPAGSLFNLEA